VSEDDLQRRAQALIDDPNRRARGFVDDAGIEAAFPGRSELWKATYTTSTALHFQMEPLNALAFEKGRDVRDPYRQPVADPGGPLGSPRPWESRRKRSSCAPTGSAEASAGGLNGDYVVPAALAAKATGRPVKMVCTRADDVPLRFAAFPDRSAPADGVRPGRPSAGDAAMNAAAGWPNQAMDPDDLPKDAKGVVYDPDAVNGANHWYDVGAHRVRAICNDLANTCFRPGWLRSVGPGWTNWGGGEFHGRGRSRGRQGSGGVSARPARWIRRQCRWSGGDRRRSCHVWPRRSGGARRQGQGVGPGVATSFGQGRDMPTWTALRGSFAR